MILASEYVLNGSNVGFICNYCRRANKKNIQINIVNLPRSTQHVVQACSLSVRGSHIMGCSCLCEGCIVFYLCSIVHVRVCMLEYIWAPVFCCDQCLFCFLIEYDFSLPKTVFFRLISFSEPAPNFGVMKCRRVIQMYILCILCVCCVFGLVSVIHVCLSFHLSRQASQVESRGPRRLLCLGICFVP